MQKEVRIVPPGITISELRKYITESNHTGFPVVENNELVGLVTFDDIRQVSLEDQDKTLVGDVATKNVISVYPEQSMKYAMDMMHENQIGRLPVVSRDDPTKLLGIITRTDAIRAYESEVHA